MKITSAANPLIKEVLTLHTVKGRKATRKCIIEGKRALSTTSLTLDMLFCTPAMEQHAQTLSTKVIVIPETLMQKISPSITPPGLLGVCHIPQNQPPEFLTAGLVLANITNPGTMGTLIRTAAACNLTSVVVVEGCDPWSPKVLQATAGTSVTLFQLSWHELLSHKKDLILTALVVSGGSAPSTIDRERALLVVGNEAHGIAPQWLADCEQQVTIPMPGNAESLNAAVAGSLALYLGFVYNNLM